ncbi:hypothetical protein [Pseudofrankia sp. BMG5.36]|uniref:hypothetical protein n=1 Tax=Pseudofrankia sp. BMG5.36 TaxID=1834512 RepID=UPI0008D95DB4|nr:hypothetical protein [Pseudofrankia sp. BMG5.36]OHV45683.1 hypothetical protein BCD48_22115 [Pseudofrankia sp. BMG5.36]
MKGLGRSAALLGLAGAASVILTIGGPGLGIAQAADGNGDRKDNGALDDKNRDKDCIDGTDDGRNDDWFKDGILGDRDKDKDCVVGAGVGVGVGGGGGGGGGGGAPGGGPGGVAAGGGGMATNSTPVLPLAGAGLGAILLTVGVVNRRRGQGTI